MNPSRIGAAARHRRHDHTVSRFESVDAAGSEKIYVWHRVFSVICGSQVFVFAIG